MRRNVQLKRSPMKPRTTAMPRGAKRPISGAPLGGKLRGAEVPQNRQVKAVAARRRSVRDTGPSANTRELVLERDGYACVCCGRSVIGQVYSLQHRKRRSQGGDNSPCNLVTVLGDGARGCHARIDSRADPHDEARGYTVRSWDDPALVPVMVFSPGGSGVTMWPTADGRWVSDPPAVST